MRIGIYGNHLALALVACAEVAGAANQTAVFRSDVMFKADQVEPFDLVVALESSFAAAGVVEAYRAKATPTFLVPQVGVKQDLLASDAFRAYAEHLGIVLPTPEQIVDEIEAEAKARAEAEAQAGAAAQVATTGTIPPAPPAPIDPPAPSDDAADDATEPFLPKVADLAAHVAPITDVDALLELMQHDTRKTAAPIYEARFTALTAAAPAEG